MDDEEITLPFASKEAERLIEDQQLREIIDRQAKKAILSMVQFHELEMMYTCAIKEVKTKFEVLSTEFNCKYIQVIITQNDVRTVPSELLKKPKEIR